MDDVDRLCRVLAMFENKIIIIFFHQSNPDIVRNHFYIQFCLACFAVSMLPSVLLYFSSDFFIVNIFLSCIGIRYRQPAPSPHGSRIPVVSYQ